MSEGKNFFVGTIGKIISWFRDSFWGPIAKGIFGMVSLNTFLGGMRGFFKEGNDGILTELVRSFTYLAAQVPILGKPFIEAFEFLTQFQLDRKKGGLGFAIKGALDGVFTYADIWKKQFVSLMEAAAVDGAGKFTAFNTALKGMTGIGSVGFGLIATAIASLTSSYGGLGGVLERIKKMFSDMIDIAKNVMDALGANEALQAAREGFEKLAAGLKKVYDALAVLKPV